MEQTLVVFKPDAVMRGIVGEILTRFERAGFKVIGMKMVRPGYDQLHGHYEGIGTLKTRKGEEIFESQLAAMQVGPVIAMVLEGVEAVEFVRKMVGDTQPKTAMPGTIRGDYAHVTYGQAASVAWGLRTLCMLLEPPTRPSEKLRTGSLIPSCMTMKPCKKCSR